MLNNAEKTTIAPLNIYMIETSINSKPYVMTDVAHISKNAGTPISNHYFQLCLIIGL